MKKLLLCFIFMSLLASCDKLDNPDPPSSELDGKWELQDAVCFCFYPDDFDFSVHQLEFISSDKKIIVENSSETFFISDVGSYDFQIEDNKIVIDNTFEYTYELKEGMLVMTFLDDPEIADDEITLTYKKSN